MWSAFNYMSWFIFVDNMRFDPVFLFPVWKRTLYQQNSLGFFLIEVIWSPATNLLPSLEDKSTQRLP